MLHLEGSAQEGILFLIQAIIETRFRVESNFHVSHSAVAGACGIVLATQSFPQKKAQMMKLFSPELDGRVWERFRVAKP